MKSLAFNYLSTPDKESGLSCLQSACIKGDIETVSAILNYSPDKLDSAIAFSVKIGWNASKFPGKSIYTVLRQQDSKEHKQISEFVKKVTSHFQSQSLLHLAAKKGQFEHVSRLLDCGEDVEQPYSSLLRETPLMMAARFNELDVVEFLVERGASLEMEDVEGFTALHHAAIGGKARNLLRFIELGSNVSTVNYNKTSAIHLAAEKGHTEAVRILLEHGADVKKVDYFGTTPLMLAAKNGHLETINLLLKNGDNFNNSGEGGKFPLHFAAESDHADVVRLILQNNSNILSKTSKGDTVLHLATSLELVCFLVEQGADIHARNYFARTPLHAAAEKGQSDTITYLLNQGADINSRDEAGRSALYYAVYCGHADAAKVLINRDCDLNLIYRDGYVTDSHLLIAVAEKGFTDVLQLLFDRGFSDSIDRVSIYGETVLTAAARGGHYDTVVFLLDQGANVNGSNAAKSDEAKETCGNQRDSDGEGDQRDEGEWCKYISPLHCALYADQREVAKLLIERGADTSDCRGENTTHATLAAKYTELLSDEGFNFDNSEDGETLLTKAVSTQDFNSIVRLLEKGVDVNAKNVRGDTALSLVMMFTPRPRALEIVKLLIAYGADINTKSDSSDRPLAIACSENLDKVAELFLELGCDANVQSNDLYTPLHHAARHNNSRLVKTLLQYGANAEMKTFGGELTPLHIAAKSNSLHVPQLLVEHGVELEAKNSLGRTALVEAAAYGSLPIVELLIRQGSNVHTTDKCGKTPLLHVVECVRWRDRVTEGISLIRTFLDHGCSVHSTDEYGRSPLHYLPFNDTGEVCDLFLNYGAVVTLPDINGETPLHFAATDGNTAAVDWLLEQGADLSSVDKENRTALHAAAYEGNSSLVELLIQHGADVHLADSKGWQPLHFAAAGGQIRAAEALVQNGSNVAAVDNKGRTALYLAAKHGFRELIEFLIHHGSDVNAKPFNGRTILGAAIESNFSNRDWNVLEVYLENGCDLHAVDTVTGRTVLHFAATSNSVTTLDNILEQGLDIEARDNNGDTPLHRAAARGTPEIVQRLVDRGADIMAVNNRRQNPFLVSVAVGNKEEAEILLKQGSNVQVADIDGNTPLHFAVELPRLLKRIIKNGGDVNAVNVNGCTPLHRASCLAYSTNVVKFLLKAGGDIHCRDNQGNTPLHIAMTRIGDDVANLLIKNGSDVKACNLQGKTCLHMMSSVCAFGVNFVEHLILHGVQVNAVDELGGTPLHFAVQQNDWVQAKDLLKHGADPEAVDYKGSTPLHVGCFIGSREAVSVIIDHGRYEYQVSIFFDVYVCLILFFSCLLLK